MRAARARAGGNHSRVCRRTSGPEEGCSASARHDILGSESESETELRLESDRNLDRDLVRSGKLGFWEFGEAMDRDLD